jgi:hypothetical protein
MQTNRYNVQQPSLCPQRVCVSAVTVRPPRAVLQLREADFDFDWRVRKKTANMSVGFAVAAVCLYVRL